MEPVEAAAQRLLDAARTGVPCPPARELGDPLTRGRVVLSGALGPMVPVVERMQGRGHGVGARQCQGQVLVSRSAERSCPTDLAAAPAATGSRRPNVTFIAHGQAHQPSLTRRTGEPPDPALRLRPSRAKRRGL